MTFSTILLNIVRLFAVEDLFVGLLFETFGPVGASVKFVLILHLCEISNRFFFKSESDLLFQNHPTVCIVFIVYV